MTDAEYAMTMNLTRLSDAGAILSRVVPDEDDEKARLRKITAELMELQAILFAKIQIEKEKK